MSERKTVSIIEMARGAVIEQINREMAEILANIQDLNTEPGKPRSITVKVVFRPDNSREIVKVSYDVSHKLAPAAPIETSLSCGDYQGELYAVENVPQIPGQQALIGQEQEPPKLVALN